MLVSGRDGLVIPWTINGWNLKTSGISCSKPSFLSSMLVFGCKVAAYTKNMLLRKKTRGMFFCKRAEQMIVFDGSKMRRWDSLIHLIWNAISLFAVGFHNIKTTMWYRLSSINMPKTQQLRLQGHSWWGSCGVNVWILTSKFKLNCEQRKESLQNMNSN